MRKTLMACTAIAMAAMLPAAQAQDEKSTKFETMVSKVLNANALNGVSAIAVINSYPVPLTITCDKWQLVGPNKYKSVNMNPNEIEPFSITIIRTDEFDGYCKNGLVGHLRVGRSVTAKLDADDFTHSTTVLFSPMNNN